MSSDTVHGQLETGGTYAGRADGAGGGGAHACGGGGCGDAQPVAEVEEPRSVAEVEEPDLRWGPSIHTYVKSKFGTTEHV
jgi:hypothetical protein